MYKKFYNAIIENNNADVQALIKNVNPNIIFNADFVQFNASATPLQVAIVNNDVDIVKTLLNNQADPNIVKADLAPALALAVMLGRNEIAEVLIDPQYGCDLFLGTPYYEALWTDNKTLMNKLPLSMPQDYLIEVLKLLGYEKVQEKGICYGIAQMSKYAVQQRKIEVFNKNLETLLRLYIKTKSITDDGDKQSRIFKEFINSLKVRDELYALCDGIILYQDQTYHEYDYLYTTARTAPLSTKNKLIDTLICPASLAKTNNPICVAHFTGAYSKEDLMIYLDSIRTGLINRQAEMPISILMFGNGHAMNLGYDPLKDVWYFVNANALPIQTVLARSQSELTMLAAKILHAFSQDDYVLFASDIYVAGSNQQNIVPDLNQIFISANWKNIHKVTREKLGWKTLGKTWERIALEQNDYKTIARIATAQYLGSNSPLKNNGFFNALPAKEGVKSRLDSSFKRISY